MCPHSIIFVFCCHFFDHLTSSNRHSVAVSVNLHQGSNIDLHADHWRAIWFQWKYSWSVGQEVAFHKNWVSVPNYHYFSTFTIVRCFPPLSQTEKLLFQTYSLWLRRCAAVWTPCNHFVSCFKCLLLLASNFHCSFPFAFKGNLGVIGSRLNHFQVFSANLKNSCRELPAQLFCCSGNSTTPHLSYHHSSQWYEDLDRRQKRQNQEVVSARLYQDYPLNFLSTFCFCVMDVKSCCLKNYSFLVAKECYFSLKTL